MADLTTFDPLFLALFSNANGTGELSGNGYARLSITNDATVFDVDGAGDRLTKVALATVVATGAGWGVIRSVGFFDLSTAGTLLATVATEPFSVAVNQGVAFGVGALGYTDGASGAITPALPSLYNIPRSLFLYENVGLEALSVPARSLYPYENVGVEPLVVDARALYGYENLAIEELVALARSLYGYEATRDGEVFPWLMKIDPTEQYRGGQIDLFGDGFGELLEVAADVGTTITTSSVSGANVGGNTVDRDTPEWVSTSSSGAWIRFAFATPKTISAVALEDVLATDVAWGVPLFRFSDGGADVVGSSAVVRAEAILRSSEYPVGAVRTLYALPALRTTDYVEIRVSSGGAGVNRGLGEVWIYTDTDATAEGSSPVLNDGLVAETALGIVTWRNRSPGLHPANGGLPIEAAATATIPPDAESGLVVVEETI